MRHPGRAAPDFRTAQASNKKVSNKKGVATVASGTVKWFNPEKGYGFISQPDGGADVFVHHTAIQMNGYRLLEEGQSVEFEVEEGPKGLMAREVRPAMA
jgi:cold shock protein